ncbi:MAG: Flp pilus assembly protein CpaB [Myxococcota bacterium]|nr:Flp pilus assembly protein CpaB [Myxococcota bacterium]MDW8363783.1 Flp pilus assembly protein CpaB [Myxococcales bacterium]
MNVKALLAAAVTATIGFALLWLYVRRFEQEASGGPPVAVLMAAEDIPLGAAITREMLGVHHIPSRYVEDRHIRASEVDRIVGVRVSMGVKANESLLWSDLATTSEARRDLSALVRQGFRAVTVRADSTSAFGGLLRPGDRVDVLLTTTRGEGGAGETVTMLLLQNALVLAVGRDTGSPAQSHARREEQRFNEIALGVTVEQASVLAYAQQTGRITLSLRNPDDIAVVEALPETTRNDLLEPERRARLQRREPSREPTSPVQPQLPTRLQ